MKTYYLFLEFLETNSQTSSENVNKQEIVRKLKGLGYRNIISLLYDFKIILLNSRMLYIYAINY